MPRRQEECHAQLGRRLDRLCLIGPKKRKYEEIQKEREFFLKLQFSRSVLSEKDIKFSTETAADRRKQVISELLLNFNQNIQKNRFIQTILTHILNNYNENQTIKSRDVAHYLRIRNRLMTDTNSVPSPAYIGNMFQLILNSKIEEPIYGLLCRELNTDGDIIKGYYELTDPRVVQKELLGEFDDPTLDRLFNKDLEKTQENWGEIIFLVFQEGNKKWFAKLIAAIDKKKENFFTSLEEYVKSKLSHEHASEEYKPELLKQIQWLRSKENRNTYIKRLNEKIYSEQKKELDSQRLSGLDSQRLRELDSQRLRGLDSQRLRELDSQRLRDPDSEMEMDSEEMEEEKEEMEEEMEEERGPPMDEETRKNTLMEGLMELMKILDNYDGIEERHRDLLLEALGRTYGNKTITINPTDMLLFSSLLYTGMVQADQKGFFRIFPELEEPITENEINMLLELKKLDKKEGINNLRSWKKSLLNQVDTKWIKEYPRVIAYWRYVYGRLTVNEKEAFTQILPKLQYEIMNRNEERIRLSSLIPRMTTIHLHEKRRHLFRFKDGKVKKK